MDEESVARRGQTRIEFITGGARTLAGLVSGGMILGGCVDRRPRQPDELDELRKTESSKVGYRESGRIETGFAQARGVAVAHDGSLYVAGDQAIRVFSRNGAMKREIALAGSPECLTFDPSGTLFTGMDDHVEVLESGASSGRAWPSLGAKTVITSVAADGESVWVADAGNRRAVRLNRAGAAELSVGKRDADHGYPGLNVPSPHMDVALAAGGTVYVGNPGEHRVEMWSADGNLQSTWGEYGTAIEGFCGCCNPTDFALLPDGRFVTAEKGLPRVKVYSKEGKFQWVVAGAEMFAEDTAGIDVAADRDGNVIVLDPKHQIVRIYAPIQGRTS